MTHTKRKSKIILMILLAVILILCGISVWYVNDYYHAVDVDEALTSSDTVTVSSTDTGMLFDGPGTKDALIFYPGAKVEAAAYAPLLKLIAESGIDCFLVKMPCNLAFFGINKADDIMADYSYEHWYLSGHSLGGAMAASYAGKHLNDLDGLILLASYSTSDLTKADFPVISIYGSNDGVLNMDKVVTSRNLMPSDYSEHVIDGGNHAGFGSYGAQKGDHDAEISKKEQWQETVSALSTGSFARSR